MYRSVRPLLLAASLGATVPGPGLAQSYPIDCAILLCLAGGWPASAPCAKAKAEFIRRLTPWPVEPPLQIWRCPMGARAAAAVPDISLGRAEIDLTAPVLAALRSLRVWQVEYQQFEGRGYCRRRDESRMGSYGAGGAFTWAPMAADAMPAATGVKIPRDCRPYTHRALRVEWIDQTGAPGSEMVRY